MRRRLLIGLLCLLALVLVASFATWRWAESEVERNFANWTRTVARQGWTVRTAPPIPRSR